MRVRAVSFVTSAVGAEGLPRDAAPQVALVGRSNVGKSTLINALTGQRVARTSAAAGKTRLLNVYRLTRPAGREPQALYLVDLPGYGYARGGHASAETFDRLTAEYFACRPDGQQAAHPGARGPSAALLVVDSRHPGLALDTAAAAWLAARDLPWAIVASKIDKLNRAERLRVETAWSKTWNAPVTPVSAATGEGLEALWTLMLDLLKAASRPAPKPRRSTSPP